MAFTKINAAGIGTTETVTVDGLTVINDGSFGGNLSVGGTLTYEDVTNVDSVGLITARNGIVVGSGITLSKDGNIFATGISTLGGDIQMSGDNPEFEMNAGGPRFRVPSSNTLSIFTSGGLGSTSDERVRLDSSGRLLLGTTTEGHSSADDLTIATSGSTGITIRTGTTNQGNIYFADGTSGASQYAGLISYNHNTNHMFFGTDDGTERVRITSGGAVGINETSPSAMLHVENDNANASTYYLNSDATVLFQNKNSSATAKTVLKLEGPAGGGDCAFVYGDSSANLIFSDRENQRLRISSAGDVTVSDGDLIFGANGNALDFQNQTRESTSNYNRTVTAEKIDYYEEGYLDPTAISAGLTWDTSNNRQLRYVRIGNWVSVSGYLQLVSRTSNTNIIKVAMPYTSAPNSEGYYTRGVGAVMYQNITLNTNYNEMVAYVGGGENYMRFFQMRSGYGWQQLLNNNLGSDSSTAIYFSINYMVA